jgi:hypothetical protein
MLVRDQASIGGSLNTEHEQPDSAGHPPGAYTYNGTLSCQFFRGPRSDGGRPDGPPIMLATGPWPLTITDAEPS